MVNTSLERRNVPGQHTCCNKPAIVRALCNESSGYLAVQSLRPVPAKAVLPRSGPGGPLLVAKKGPPGLIWAAKSGPTLPKVVHRPDQLL